jgi:hypothetical protein
MVARLSALRTGHCFTPQKPSFLVLKVNTFKNFNPSHVFYGPPILTVLYLIILRTLGKTDINLKAGFDYCYLLFHAKRHFSEFVLFLMNCYIVNCNKQAVQPMNISSVTPVRTDDMLVFF